MEKLFEIRRVSKLGKNTRKLLGPIFAEEYVLMRRTYLESYQTSMMVPFSRNIQLPLRINYLIQELK